VHFKSLLFCDATNRFYIYTIDINMNKRLSKIALMALTSLGVCLSTEQVLAGGAISTTTINTINTAVPFLRIAPDARSGAMGDVGVALSEDANSIFYNPAKLAFAQKNMAMAATYTPWLKALNINDIYLTYLSAYKKVGKNQAIGASLRYFSLGDITFTNYQGDAIGNFRPREMSFDIDYSRLLSKHLSVGLAMRYIYSNLAAGQTVNGAQVRSANGVAADLSMYYWKNVKLGDQKAKWSLGSNVSNIGTKMTYTRSAVNKDFLPANLGIGTALKMDIDKYNTVEFALDMNKLLVPTPALASDSITSYQSASPITAAIHSFNDAPGGMSEEFREINYSAGVEYWYNNLFALRSGYFYENPTKGNRQYMTFGMGIHYTVFNFNFSYLVAANKGAGQTSPLNNTLRFSLLFDFNAMAADEKPINP